MKKAFVNNTANVQSFCPPLHEETDSWPLINPAMGGGDSVEVHISEIRPCGAALQDFHDHEDHVFYVLSGRGYTVVDGERLDINPGDALWVARQTFHEIHVTGRETLRLLVVLAPAKRLK